MKSIHESLVWLKDEQGKKYICEFEEDKSMQPESYEQLSDEEKSHCRSDYEFPWN